MAKLHEVLAAEKTRVAAWNKLHAETIHKLKSPTDFFTGHSKALSMIEDTPSNKALEAQAAEEKIVVSTVRDTLDYAFTIFGKSEDLQFQKNATNRVATGTVMWEGTPLLTDMPVDELLGLEARLAKIKELYETMPTLGGAREWVRDPSMGEHVWKSAQPEYNTKTEKVMVPVTLAPATDKHPAQVEKVTRDNVVGKVTIIHRSGACTTNQKAAALALVDALLVEIKHARMRANETEVVKGEVGKVLVNLLMSPFNEE
jgi:hypothetical protein